MSDSGSASNVATTAASAYALHAVASERERDNARHKNCAWLSSAAAPRPSPLFSSLYANAKLVGVL